MIVFESATEMALVVEPTDEGDLGQRLISFAQLSGGMIQLEASNIFAQGAAITPAKGPGQMGGMDSNRIGNPRQAKWLRKFFANEISCLTQPMRLHLGLSLHSMPLRGSQ